MVSVISPGFAFLHIFFKSCACEYCDIWFNCKLPGIDGFLWGKIDFLCLSVALLQAADIANGYTYLEIIF